MNLFIDGNSATLPERNDATVDDVLESVRIQNRRDDRAILAITCDGVDVLGNDLADVLDSPASQFKRIDVQTGDPSYLVIDALESASSTLDMVQDRQARLIALLGEGKTAEAMQLLSECISHWLTINDVIGQSIALLGRNVDGLRNDAPRLHAMLEPVREKLKEIREAITSHDFVLLSDILEYEFPQVTVCWLRVIEAVREHTTPQRIAPR